MELWNTRKSLSIHYGQVVPMFTVHNRKYANSFSTVHNVLISVRAYNEVLPFATDIYYLVWQRGFTIIPELMCEPIQSIQIFLKSPQEILINRCAFQTKPAAHRICYRSVGIANYSSFFPSENKCLQCELILWRGRCKEYRWYFICQFEKVTYNTERLSVCRALLYRDDTNKQLNDYSFGYGLRLITVAGICGIFIYTRPLHTCSCK
jgi:hypothetical protein